jgi:hypothetical protein
MLPDTPHQMGRVVVDMPDMKDDFCACVCFFARACFEGKGEKKLCGREKKNHQLIPTLAFYKKTPSCQKHTKKTRVSQSAQKNCGVFNKRGLARHWYFRPPSPPYGLCALSVLASAPHAFAVCKSASVLVCA